jgi:hypothetical protein
MTRAHALRWALGITAALVVAVAPGTALAAPPANDNFSAAEILQDRFGYTDGDNTEATKEFGEPNHAGNPGGASVWYTWTAPHSGRMTLSLCYSEFDTLLAVYTGDQLIDLQQVAADDNGCGEGSRVTFTTSAEATYRIAVDGANGATGYFELDWGLGPPNDDFAAAVVNDGDSGTVSGDNWYATTEAGEPEHGPYGGSSVWYRWTAPSSGPATFDLCDSSFDTLLAVYTGASVGALTRVAQDNDDCPYSYGGSRVSFVASGGQEYRIAVDGADGERGEITLRWSRETLAPRGHVPPSVVGRAVDGATLSATTGEWGGTPPLTFGYQWARCSTTGSTCQLLSGATGPSYLVTSPDVGYRVKVLVTATNAGGSATVESGSTAIISPVAPSNITPPRILEEPYLGVELSIEEGEWSGTQPLSYAYRWQRCHSGGSCADIEGETSSTYTVTREDLKSSLLVIVTASNGAGSATAASPLSRRASRRLFCVVPRVKGKALATARRAIRRAHCSVGRVRYARSQRARGRVISQSLRPSLRRPSGTKVNLVVSKGRRR